MNVASYARRITRGLHAAGSSKELFAALRHSLGETGHGGTHAVVLRDPKEQQLQLCASSEPEHIPGTVLSTLDAPCLTALDAEHLALVRVQLQEETSRRHQNDLTKLSLMSLAGEVIRSIELEPILAKLMELALSAVEAEVGCIVLCGEDGPSVRVEWGLGADLLQHLHLADGRAITDAVIADVQPRMSQHVPSDPEVIADGPAEAIGSLAVVPLATRERVLGCLVVARGKGGGFEERDLDLLSVTTGLSSNAIENALLHRTEVERERLEAELRLAGEVQRGLLPTEVPALEGVCCAANVWPCDESGGDYYDFMKLDEHRLAFCVGDATGHGIGAAFITTTARACLRACLSDTEVDLGLLFGQVSGLLEDDLSDGKFITMFLGVFDSRDRTISYVSAGHDPGILYRQTTDTFEELEATGAPLGIFPGLTFDSATTEPLQPGDFLVVKTDGITEAENPAGIQFGEERLRDAIRARQDTTPQEVVQSLHDYCLEYRETAPQTDDITILCLRATDA